MEDPSTLIKPPSPLQLRNELEAMVVNDLVGPGGQVTVILNSSYSGYVDFLFDPGFRSKNRGGKSENDV